MKAFLRLVSILAVLVCAALSHAAAQAPDFDRYQVILSRMPFGSEPVVAAPGAQVAPPVAPSESFARNLKMCAVTRNALTGKLQVGLVDNATKKNYFLKVGQEEDGIVLVEADYEGERAFLRKGGEEVWIGMNDVSAPPPPPVAPPAMRGSMGLPTISRRQVARRDAPAPAAPAPPPPPREPKFKGEELAKHLEQYQMDLIRAGGEKGPPLPMELTPEMDKQLVSEGVLPPNE